jgi:hypothetical protein
MERLHDFLDTMRPHWSALALLVTWAGIAFVGIRRRLHWRKKRFLAQVNFSLNYRIGNSLAMRTLIERDATDVWFNEYGVKLVFAAAARTSEEDPFLTFKNPTDQDFVNRAVLNVLSSRFAETFVAASLGLPVRSANYCFAVSCEKFKIMRTIKLRVLIMEEQEMIELFGPEGVADQLEVCNPVYSNRLRSLRAMYRVYEKDQGSTHPILGKVELGIVVAGSPALVSPNGASVPCATSASPVA